MEIDLRPIFDEPIINNELNDFAEVFNHISKGIVTARSRGLYSRQDRLIQKLINHIELNMRANTNYYILIQYKLMNNHYSTLSQNSMSKFILLLKERFINGREYVESGSEKFNEIDFDLIMSMQIIDQRNINLNNAGGMFIYTNETSIDLSKYQIFTTEEIKEFVKEMKLGTREEINFDDHIFSRHCILQCLMLYRVDTSIILSIKTLLYGPYLKKNLLHKIVDIINEPIELHYYNKDNIVQKYIYKGKLCVEGDVRIKIALYDAHYFKYEIVDYHRWYLENYNNEKFINNPRIREITKLNGKGYPNYSNEYKMSSLQMIHYLKNINMFRPFQKGELYSISKNLIPIIEPYNKIDDNIIICEKDLKNNSEIQSKTMIEKFEIDNKILSYLVDYNWDNDFDYICMADTETFNTHEDKNNTKHVPIAHGFLEYTKEELKNNFHEITKNTKNKSKNITIGPNCI